MTTRVLGRVVSYLVLILIGLIGIAPFVYLLILSFKNQLDILSVPPSLHFNWSQITSNYGHVIHEQSYLTFVKNSVIVTGISTLIALGLAVPIRYEIEPLGVLADAFFVKPFRFEELLAKIADLLRDAPPRPAIKRDRAPVWVPRNGEYYVITCTDCLRSFSIPAEKSARVLRELRTLECIFCEAQVRFIVEEKPEASGLPMIANDGDES